MYPGRVGIYGKTGKKYTLDFRYYGLLVTSYELRVANSKLLIGNIPFL